MQIKKWLKLHREDNRGAAMIVVTCVLMVVSILALTLLVAAYQMFATVNDEGKDEYYYQQAMSFSEVLRTRLTADDADTSTDTLVAHISSFMKDDTKETEVLEGTATDMNIITLTLDKTEAKNFLVITVSSNMGSKVMANVKSKYKPRTSGEGYTYELYEYY